MLAYKDLDERVGQRVEQIHFVAKNPEVSTGEYTLKMVNSTVRIELRRTLTQECLTSTPKMVRASVTAKEVVDLFAKVLQIVGGTSSSGSAIAQQPGATAGEHLREAVCECRRKDTERLGVGPRLCAF